MISYPQFSENMGDREVWEIGGVGGQRCSGYVAGCRNGTVGAPTLGVRQQLFPELVDFREELLAVNRREKLVERSYSL